MDLIKRPNRAVRLRRKRRRDSDSSARIFLLATSASHAVSIWLDIFESIRANGPFNVTVPDDSRDWIIYGNMRKRCMSMKRSPEIRWRLRALGSNARCGRIECARLAGLALGLEGARVPTAVDIAGICQPPVSHLRRPPLANPQSFAEDPRH
jgi:hypothetical protein